MFKKLVQGLVNLFFVLIVGAALSVAFLGEPEFAPEMPSEVQEGGAQNPSIPARPADDEGGDVLPAPSPFDDRAIVDAEDAKNWTSGTGFAIASGGIWLTAKHVARGCDRLGILNDDGRIAVKARPIYISDNADVAIFQTQGGPPPLALDLDESDIKVGSRAFHVGYPQGKPGEVTSRLIGRELLMTRGAWQGKEETLSWAETGRTSGLVGTLGGLSGGPAFDMKGNVIGITIAENPRRGRITTTSAASMSAALSEASISASGNSVSFSQDDSLAQSAKALRAGLKVVQVLCMKD